MEEYSNASPLFYCKKNSTFASTSKNIMVKRLLTTIPYEILSVPAKTVLLEAGKAASKVFLVHKGCIRQWYNADGKDITCQFFFEGSPVACIDSLINATPSEYTLETVLPSEVYVIKGEDIKATIQSHPERMGEMVKFSIERMVCYSKLFLSRIKETPQERYESLVREHPEIVTQIPQHYIASYLGITPVSLSRIRNRK